MAVSPKPLDVVTTVVQQVGLDVIYEYQNLIFVSHNLFILKFAGQHQSIDLYFNENIDEEKAQALMALLDEAAQDKGLDVEYKGAFCLLSQEDEDIELEFYDLADD